MKVPTDYGIGDYDLGNDSIWRNSGICNLNMLEIGQKYIRLWCSSINRQYRNQLANDPVDTSLGFPCLRIVSFDYEEV